MISLKKLAEDLQDKLNAVGNGYGVKFAIKADSKNFDKSLRKGNTVEELINGLLTVQSSDLSNLTDGQLFATMGCELQVIFRLKGNENDDDTEIVNPDTNEVVKVIEGNNTKIERVRNALSATFQKNTQEPMTDTDGRTYLVSTLYQFIETGNRDQVQILGDSMSFTAYVSYMFVENGVNTRDIKYYLDGHLIPFQTNTAYRSPTMDGNVYADSINGAVKNIASQSIFTISFQLPALRNDITALMFDWLFNGDLNTAHILCIEYSRKTANKEAFYLVAFGENNASGETIKNIGQTMTLVECIDDYELVKISSACTIYQRTSSSVTSITFTGTEVFVYNFMTKEFKHAINTTTNATTVTVDMTAHAGDFIMTTRALVASDNNWVMFNG